jgi:hypothetical protein
MTSEEHRREHARYCHAMSGLIWWLKDVFGWRYRAAAQLPECGETRAIGINPQRQVGP